MTEQERKVVNHAMKILEQSQDDEARALAVKLLEQGTKVPLQKVQFYAAYCNGLRDGYSRIFDLIQGGGWLRKILSCLCPWKTGLHARLQNSLSQYEQLCGESCTQQAGWVVPEDDNQSGKV